MRLYCPAIQHFRNCHGNYKLSYVQGKVVRLVRAPSSLALVRASPTTLVLSLSPFEFFFSPSFSPPLQFFFSMDAHQI